MLPETSKTKSSKIKSLFLPKSSSFSNNLNSINKIDQKRNESLKLNQKIKFSLNEINSNNTLNKTLKPPSSSSKKFPLLLSKFNNKINIDEQRLINYQKMRKYRVKLIKAPQTKKKLDNVYKLFKDNGLQFLFPPQRKINDGNPNQNYQSYRSKKSPKKLRISLSSQNLNSLKYKIVSPQSISNNLKVYQKKNPEEEEEFYKPSFKKYMKLQSLADMKFRPVLGDNSSDLVNFLKKIELIRKEVINNYIDEINNVENRFNIERPKEDFRFKTKMQGLYHHKWKNIFKLRDYQDLFCENLRGKISSKNFDIMERNFRNIFLMCFSTGGNKNNII